MRFYKFPKWLKRFYTGAIWDFFLTKEKALYLTFDDGPNPETTEWILNLLAKHQAKATFFCLGKNVDLHPRLFKKLTAAGHTVGNHGMLHLNGFYTPLDEYINDMLEGQKRIQSPFFRPAYGRMTRSQFREAKKLGYSVVFWSHLTYDFDAALAAEKRMAVIRKNTKAGTVFVFHDSDKAFPQLKNELPVLMNEWIQQGFIFKTIKD